MYLARGMTRLSLEEIGGHFGSRDHTTVMHSIKAVEHKRQRDKKFDAEVLTISDQLAKSNV
jgi:chromosomal replication initiator protein